MLSSLLYDVSNTNVLDAEKVYPMHSVDALKKGERRQIKRGVNSILRNLRLGFDAFPRPESRVYASDKGIRQRRKRRRRRVRGGAGCNTLHAEGAQGHAGDL